MKAKFSTDIKKFAANAEKTGWQYIIVPADIAQQLKPGNRRSFRVKGTLDNFPIKLVAVMPMGDGNFLLSINSEMRKGTGKSFGAILNVSLSPDNDKIEVDGDLLECLSDEPTAHQYFISLTPSHQNYFSKWIQSSKTPATKAKRITLTIDALLKGLNYSEMIRASQGKSNT